MQASSALEIINALIDGAHPFSGESLSQESVLEDPRVLRALFTAVRALEKEMTPAAQIDTQLSSSKLYSEEDRGTAARTDNAGAPWQQSEELYAVSRFKSGYSVSHIANKLGRSKGAVQKRLRIMGAIPQGFYGEYMSELIDFR